MQRLLTVTEFHESFAICIHELADWLNHLIGSGCKFK